MEDTGEAASGPRPVHGIQGPVVGDSAKSAVGIVLTCLNPRSTIVMGFGGFVRNRMASDGSLGISYRKLVDR